MQQAPAQLFPHLVHFRDACHIRLNTKGGGPSVDPKDRRRKEWGERVSDAKSSVPDRPPPLTSQPSYKQLPQAESSGASEICWRLTSANAWTRALRLRISTFTSFRLIIGTAANYAAGGCRPLFFHPASHRGASFVGLFKSAGADPPKDWVRALRDPPGRIQNTLVS